MRHTVVQLVQIVDQLLCTNFRGLGSAIDAVVAFRVPGEQRLDDRFRVAFLLRMKTNPGSESGQSQSGMDYIILNL